MGVGGAAVLGGVLASVSQHALESGSGARPPSMLWGGSSGSRLPSMPFTRRAIFLSVLFLFFGVCFVFFFGGGGFFLLLLLLFFFGLVWLVLFTPHRIWMKSVCVVLYVCSLDASLWG